MQALALIATRKGLFQLDRDLSIKLAGFVGVPVSMVLGSATSSDYYAALNHGHFGVKLHHSNEPLKNWKEISCPSYPKSIDPKATEQSVGDSLELIWSLAFANPANTQEIWAGSIPGGLFHSSDGGANWQLNQPLWQEKLKHEWFGGGYDKAGIHSICVDPRDPQQITVGVSCGGVWQTKDGGESWLNCSQGMRAEYMPPEKQFDPYIQDPHRLVQSVANPDVFWAQHHNGIFHSTDNCGNWQEISPVKPSSFGFAVVADPNDEQRAWFVPAIKDECRIPVDGRLLVNKTEDAGKTFRGITRGLPQEESYDLVYRHGLAIDSTGQCLLMGSTTGNLWISQNGGEHWQCLSQHLPPIYCIDFIR